MSYINPSLLMIIVAMAVAAAIIAIEPTAAMWLARVLYARACAVREARRTFRRVRNSEMLMVAEEE